jgi:hypothetical protein
MHAAVADAAAAATSRSSAAYEEPGVAGGRHSAPRCRCEAAAEAAAGVRVVRVVAAGEGGRHEGGRGRAAAGSGGKRVGGGGALGAVAGHERRHPVVLAYHIREGVQVGAGERRTLPSASNDTNAEAKSKYAKLNKTACL